MKKKAIMKNKKGISLIVLVITIIVAIILAEAGLTVLNSNLIESKKNNFVYEIVTIEDAVNSYYILNNVLPVDDNNGINASEVIERAKDVKKYDENKVVSYLQSEIDNSDDKNALFYKINMEKLEVESGTTDEIYYVSFPNLNVYNLKGKKIDGQIYFSKVNMIKGNVNSENKSKIEVKQNGISLNIAYHNGILTNKLGIKIEINKESNVDIALKYKNEEGNYIENTKQTISGTLFEFDTIEELNTDYETQFSDTTIVGFNKASEKSIEVRITDRDGNVLATETLDVSNYDPVRPTVEYIRTDEYTNMSVVGINLIENREIRNLKYQYMKRIDQQDKTVANYYENIESFNLEKAINVEVNNESIESSQDNQLQIKLPKDVATVCVVAEDIAGNKSDEIEMACVENIGPICNIKASVTSPTTAKSIKYTFEFDQEVEGFDISDIVVTNGSKGKFEGSGKTYTLEVDNSEYKNVLQEISIANDVCISKETQRGNYAKSIKIEINRVKKEKFAVNPNLVTI